MEEQATDGPRMPRRRTVIALVVVAVLGVLLGTGYAVATGIERDDDKPSRQTKSDGDPDLPSDLPSDEPSDEPTKDSETPPAEDPTDKPSAKTSEPTEEPVKEALSDDYLVTADRMPAVPGLGSWVDEGPQDVPTLSCQGDWLSSLGASETVSAEFRAYSAKGSTGPASGLVNLAVLEFSDAELAGAEYRTALGWLDKCPATHSELGSAPPSVSKQVRPITITNGDDIADAHEAHQAVIDVCLDGCDASLIEYETIARLEQRLVVVSYGEGSWLATTAAEKNAQAARAQKATDRAIAHGMWDFH